MQKKTTTLIYGTGNAGKLDLMRHYLSTLQEIRLLGLKDLPFCWGEIEESPRILPNLRTAGFFTGQRSLYRRTAQGASAGRACTAGKRCQPDG